MVFRQTICQALSRTPLFRLSPYYLRHHPSIWVCSRDHGTNPASRPIRTYCALDVQNQRRRFHLLPLLLGWPRIVAGLGAGSFRYVEQVGYTLSASSKPHASHQLALPERSDQHFHQEESTIQDLIVHST